MKKSIILALSDKELIELERIMVDDDASGALRFLQKHIGNKARGLWREQATASLGLRFLGILRCPPNLESN